MWDVKKPGFHHRIIHFDLQLGLLASIFILCQLHWPHCVCSSQPGNPHSKALTHCSIKTECSSPDAQMTLYTFAQPYFSWKTSVRPVRELKNPCQVFLAHSLAPSSPMVPLTISQAPYLMCLPITISSWLECEVHIGTLRTFLLSC